MSKIYTEVPGWATSMVDNYRRNAKIPKEVSDVDLFNSIEELSLELFDDDEQAQILMLREALGIEV